MSGARFAKKNVLSPIRLKGSRNRISTARPSLVRRSMRQQCDAMANYRRE